MLYLISYDLRMGATPEDYQRMDDLLTGMGARRVLLSQWAVRVANTAEQITRLIWPHMDSNDRLLVTEITDNWVGYGLMLNLNGV